MKSTMVTVGRSFIEARLSATALRISGRGRRLPKWRDWMLSRSAWSRSRRNAGDGLNPVDFLPMTYGTSMKETEDA
jgi:hypothetical protein